MKKILRKFLRNRLKNDSIKTLRKHEITTIAVMGDGQTSLAREILYQVLKSKFPIRRNIEMSDLEFSVPLTILGIQTYPTNFVDWIKILIKNKINQKKIKPYKHYLVLELSAISKEILEYWLEITKPEMALIIGKVPVDISKYNFKKLVKISSIGEGDILNTFKIAISQIAKFYQIDEGIVETAFIEKNLPNSKLRFFPGKNNSFIIDATHFHRPIPLESALDIIENPDVRKILFSDIKADIFYLKSKKILKNWIINPLSYEPKNEDVIVIRGQRPDKLEILSNIFTQKSNDTTTR